MKNKKALSQIVTTIILIVLSLTAVSLLWATTKQVIDRVQYSPAISCLDFQTQIPAKINKACYSSETQNIEVTLTRNSQNLEINNIYFATDTNSKFCCGTDCPQCEILNTGTSKTYYLQEDTIPKEITLLLENCVMETKNVKEC